MAMIVRCEHLRDTGETAEAHRLLARIEALTEDLKRLECHRAIHLEGSVK
jgi:hypothetical protein